MLCSGQGEVLYEWQCPERHLRVEFLESLTRRSWQIGLGLVDLQLKVGCIQLRQRLAALDLVARLDQYLGDNAVGGEALDDGLQQRGGVEIGRAEQLQRPRGAATFGERRALQHHRAGVAARHREVRRVGARVHPAALVQRPAVARPRIGLPALHRHDAIVEVELQAAAKPVPELAHGEAMAREMLAHKRG